MAYYNLTEHLKHYFGFDAFKGDRPDVLFMSRKAGLLLGASRVPAVTISGKTIVSGGVDVPREFYGIPILYTDSLNANEAAV